MSSPVSAPEKALARDLPKPLLMGCLALVGIGVLSFVVGLATDPQSAWLAFHSNFIYVTMLSGAGLALTSIYTTVSAQWPGPYRRFAEGLAAFFPIAFLLSIVDFFGRDYLFEWVHHPAAGKADWLNVGRVYITDFVVMGVLAALAIAFIKASTRPTLKGLAETGQGFAKSQAEKWTADWQGDEAERAIAAEKTKKLAAYSLLAFALGLSVVAFDQVMSMDQMWFSNLFGAYVVWGGILTAVATSALLGVLHRNTAGMSAEITEKRKHDIGKLLFAFSIFWMYLFWSQYLVIYYGNLPEETGFLRDRLGDQFLVDKGYTEYAFAQSWGPWDFNWDRFMTGYGWIAMVVWTLIWIIPFWVLLGQKPKMTPWIVGPVAGGVLLGFWFERNMLVWPSIVKHDMTAFMGLMPVGIALGFLGAFAAVFLFYSRVFPTIAVSDKS